MNLSRFLSIALLAAGTVASAATLPYQGLLTDANGVPVADGDKAVSFGLYGASTGGTALWNEARTVSTRKGLFSVALGASNALTDDMFSKDTLFLSITISGSELVARTPIGMSAFAFRAHKADTAKFASDAAGLSRKLDTAALTARLAGYTPTSALSAYVTTANFTNSLGAKVDTAAITARLNGYATSSALVNGLRGKADTSALANGLGGKVDTARLTTRLSGYAPTSALSAYATATSLTTKMSTADYVVNGQLKALGGLTGGRGYDGLFNGSKITLDTTEISMEAGDKFATLGHGQLIWASGYNQWKISADPGNTFSLIAANKMFDMPVLNISASGAAQFTGDVAIDGALTLKTAAIVPDYVFEPEYKLAPLSEVEAYTRANKHLPDVPAATEIEKNGLDMVKMNLTLLRKVEELTLYTIELEKRMKAMEARSN